MLVVDRTTHVLAGCRLQHAGCAHFHPSPNPTLLSDPAAKVIGDSPLGLQVIHVVWRVQILFRAFDRCLAIGLLQT
jgi:hypothetical protein